MEFGKSYFFVFLCTSLAGLPSKLTTGASQNKICNSR